LRNEMLKGPTVRHKQNLGHSLLKVVAGALGLAALICAILSLTSAGYSSSPAAQTVDALQQKQQSESQAMNAVDGKKSLNSNTGTLAGTAAGSQGDGGTVLDAGARVPLYGTDSDNPASGDTVSSASGDGGNSGSGSGEGSAGTGSTGGNDAETGSPDSASPGSGSTGDTGGTSGGTPSTGGNGVSPNTGGGNSGSGPTGENRLKSACFGGDGHCYADQ
jgi:hypothetical protein